MTQRAESMLWPVAHAAGELLTTADLSRVKRCAGCPWLFLDQSKNGSPSMVLDGGLRHARQDRPLRGTTRGPPSWRP